MMQPYVRLSEFVVLAMLCLLLPVSVWSEGFTPDIRPGKGVTGQGKLSDYFAPLEDTNLDTDVLSSTAASRGLPPC